MIIILFKGLNNSLFRWLLTIIPLTGKIIPSAMNISDLDLLEIVSDPLLNDSPVVRFFIVIFLLFLTIYLVDSVKI